MGRLPSREWSPSFLSRCLPALLVGPAVFGAGCIATRTAAEPSKPVVEFPSARALAEIEGRPTTSFNVQATDIPADGWRVDALEVSATPDEPWQPAGAWATAFAADAADDKPTLKITRALSCVAHQLGRFNLETKSQPPTTLREFMIAACGAVVPDVGYQSVTGDVPERISDDQILRQWRHQLKHDLLAHLPAPATDAGFWSGRAHGRLVALMVYARARVRWKTLSFVPDARDDVTLEGELDGPADRISGYINEGRFGAATCAIDPGVPRPRFRAICHLAKDDPTAWLQLYAAPPKRALETVFVQILIRRTMDQPLVFDATPYAAPRPVTSVDDLSRAILESLNQVRVGAGFAPVRLSAAESQSATRLAGHFFAALLAAGDKDATGDMDEIALGLLAGWQMGGMIRDGLFMSNLAPGTRDAAQWLNLALATPFGRVTLLSKEVEEVAIGAAFPSEGGGLAALVTGYKLYHGDDHTADVERIYKRLLATRQRLGLGAPRRLPGMSEVLRVELGRVRAGRTVPGVALETALHQGATRFEANMRGYVIETTSLDALEIPEDVIRRPALSLEIAVAHHKPPGAAWAQLIILVIFAEDHLAAGQSI